MAEAHSAVAFGFTVSHEGVGVSYDLDLLKKIRQSVTRSYKRRIGKFKNALKNGVYPASPLSLIFVATLLLICRILGYNILFGAIRMFEGWLFGYSYIGIMLSTLLASVLIWFLFTQLIRVSIKALLTYKGWMYERISAPSASTRLWLLLVRALCRSKPMLYSLQGALPRLPLPSLDATLRRHLDSMRPLLDDKEFAEMERMSDEFRHTIGPKLQRYLFLKSWVSSNYVSDWWEEYVYLRGRGPIMINSNYYGIDTVYLKPTHIQAARAANLLHAAMEFRRQIVREELKPIMLFGVPLCSNQYERMFNTSRIPGIDADKIRHWDVAHHVAVHSKGCWWKLPIDNGKRSLTPAELEYSITEILNSDETPYTGEEHIGALTAGDRVPWAETRRAHLRSGVNKTALDTIERSALVLILEDAVFDFDPNDPTLLDSWAHNALHGKGYDRWFDKTFTMIISKNGRLSMNCEHSWADAPVMGHCFEYIMATTALKYKEDGHCLGEVDTPPPPPKHIKWELNDAVMAAIDSQLIVARKLIADVEMALLIFSDYGKAFVKKCKVSPDGYLQMALQLANYRDLKRFCLTYEASMTRLYREGRTETVRSVTEESCAFVRSVDDPTKTDDDRRQLLRTACERHVKNYVNAMCGRGIDRHLFTLFVVSKYLELDSPFLKAVIYEPWRLSTSQTPHQQTDIVNSNKHPEYVSAGGGFGPVADDGYGVSYIIAGEQHFSFHISSKRSCSSTSSARFRETLRRSMMDMHALFADVVTSPDKAN